MKDTNLTIENTGVPESPDAENPKNTILIVDDMEINRALLAENFKDSCNIFEAENGKVAVEMLKEHRNIDAVLLDLIMPEMNGIEVLKEMHKTGDILHIPVFIITASTSDETLKEAYDLGAVDIISKPFTIGFFQHRVANIVELYRHRNEMETIIDQQLRRFERLNRSMIETLASVIEFRDCESGEHVKRISGITRIIMTYVSNMYPEHHMSKQEIEKIALASILHDVGKISIPDGILNKPGRLTAEEFEIMKLHTVKGCDILESMPDGMMDKDIYDYCYDICRHHHERWDGKGYPDKLSSDEISIWSQVVAVADVYDALISPRVYKKAFDTETAVNMIFNGECGTFNPKVLQAFKDCLEEIRRESASALTEKPRP